MNVYCTLFDSNYIDKGLILYESLERAEKDNFLLYVFAFDDICCDILRKENRKHIKIVSMDEFETDGLRKVKKERTRAEYCWTCTPWVIKHVLERYNEPMCTYIDADMMFFSSPDYIFDKMKAQGFSILITPHRFEDTKKGQKRKKRVGTYCVEFNTFLNNEKGKEALDWWADECLKWCFYTRANDGRGYGDQKYLNEFEIRFGGVYVNNEYGAGMLPCNANQLKADAADSTSVIRKCTNEKYPIVFFHYEGISFISRKYVNVNSGISDKALHKIIYDVYIEKLITMRRYCHEKYGLDFYKRRRVTNNKIIGLLLMYVSPILHIRRLNDIYNIGGRLDDSDK